MTKEEIFAVWAPANSIWSTWTKAVLFAHLDTAFGMLPTAADLPDVNWAPRADQLTAIVLDLPGEEGVAVGAALAAFGYRPVPLYNAIPLPFVASTLELQSIPAIAAVDMLPIMSALRRWAELVADANIAVKAAPAFLLDAGRHADGLHVQPDQFDNRSICFITDFPSANFLLAQGIQRILLVQRARDEPHADLAHVLRRWQDGGLLLERMRIESPNEREQFQVSRPSWYGAMFQRALASLGLRRAPNGGFGGWMPDSSASG
jgi:hypothetical protein